MTRLTEEMVVARSRASDISMVKKLNCWGGELSDVSLLRRMTNLEVLSFSVNKISSLVDFQNLASLRELYVRNNAISDLNQIRYLEQLPQLRILWLGENPCANEAQYRLTVLKTLPNLQKLDDVVVQPEEVSDAARKGRDLMHPDDEIPQEVTYLKREDVYHPPRLAAPPSDYEVQRVPASYPPEDEDERYRQVPEERYQPQPQQMARRPSDLAYNQAANIPSTPPTASEVATNGNGSCDKCWSPVNPVPDSSSTNTYVITNTPNTSVNSGSNGASPMADRRGRRGSSASSNGSNRSSRSHTGSPPGVPTTASAHDDVPYVQREAPSEYRQYHQAVDVTPEETPYGNGIGPERRWLEPPKRTATATNLLTAVLCLLMELDYEELVQVERTVRRRKQELVHHQRHSP